MMLCRTSVSFFSGLRRKGKVVFRDVFITHGFYADSFKEDATMSHSKQFNLELNPDYHEQSRAYGKEFSAFTFFLQLLASFQTVLLKLDPGG